MKCVYYPQFFRSSRPYYNNAFVAKMIEAHARSTIDSFQFLLDAIWACAQRSGLAHDVRREQLLLAEAPIANCMFLLDRDGTPLYDIEPGLLEALAHSETGDMRLADILSPNRAYFLHWGPQSWLLLHGARPVEGAIVLRHENDWSIALVARTTQPWWVPTAQGRDCFVLGLPQSSTSLPFSSAVDLAMKAEVRFFHQAEAAQLLRIGTRSDTVPGDVLEGFRESQALNTWVLKRSLALVGNCMAYLTAYPQDTRFDWESATPASMLVKLARGGKEAARSASKLRNMGFLQVHRVGLDFQHSVEVAEVVQRVEGRDNTHASPKPHWRRGHWRNQAWGSQQLQRKLIWMRPTRVLGGPRLSSL